MKSISNYHMKNGLYEIGGDRPRSRRCRLGIRDRRPVTQLSFAIDRRLLEERRERRQKIREIEAEEERLRLLRESLLDESA